RDLFEYALGLAHDFGADTVARKGDETCFHDASREPDRRAAWLGFVVSAGSALGAAPAGEVGVAVRADSATPFVLCSAACGFSSVPMELSSVPMELSSVPMELSSVACAL